MVSREALAREIERVRRRYVSLLEELDAVPAPSVWDLAGDLLRWHVPLPDVLEFDVDVEVLADALLVRAAAPRRLKQSLLPVPPPFHATRCELRFVAGVLEVSVGRTGA